MSKPITVIVLTFLLSACQTDDGLYAVIDPSMPDLGVMVSPRSSCRITGPTTGLHPNLYRRLCRMSAHYGETIKITPNGGCRVRSRLPRSRHRVDQGCRAADITISGVGRRQILNYWANDEGGGLGYYCGKPFVHVDIGSNRQWTWFCGRRRG